MNNVVLNELASLLEHVLFLATCDLPEPSTPEHALPDDHDRSASEDTEMSVQAFTHSRSGSECRIDDVVSDNMDVESLSEVDTEDELLSSSDVSMLESVHDVSVHLEPSSEALNVSNQSTVSEFSSPEVCRRVLARRQKSAIIRYNSLLNRARVLERDQCLQEARECYESALELHPGVDESVRSSNLVDKARSLSSRGPKEEEARLEKLDDDFVRNMSTGNCELKPNFAIPYDIYKKLYSYQRKSLVWLWGLHLRKIGGILGDDMGLGKTVQMSAFLCGLFLKQIVKRVLVVCPVSVFGTWSETLTTWCSSQRVGKFQGTDKSQRIRALREVLTRGGVCVTTYGMLVSNEKELSTRPSRQDSSPTWDYVILDEGHRIKNPTTQVALASRAVPAAHRVILTGTPMQNNLQELWALLDFVTFGSILGDLNFFRSEYEMVITKANDRNATSFERNQGAKVAAELRRLIKPHLLRREKKPQHSTEGLLGIAVVDLDVARLGSQETPASKMISMDSQQPSLSVQKNDLILWVPLTDAQIQLYTDFLHSPEVAAVLNKSKSPLSAIGVLKSVCNHPMILKNVPPPTHARLTPSEARYSAVTVPGKSSRLEELCSKSGKLRVLMKLLENLREEGHRSLIFSQSKKMLNVIEECLCLERMKYLRIDGDVTQTRDRQELIQLFNRDDSIFCFLLTTQTGGLGITLTGADRVVIFDPAWNPAVDNQAVDRIYRIGQTRDVIVYRLITCSTVEEKIYRKQIFKNGLTRVATQAKEQYRYFSSDEIRTIFQLGDTTISETHKQLASLHKKQKLRYPELVKHVEFLESDKVPICGITDHDLLFTLKPPR
eukprot:349841_1